MKKQSTITGQIYDTDRCVYILNTLQVYRYLAHDAKLLDVVLGENEKLCFVFNKQDTYELYDAWCKHTL